MSDTMSGTRPGSRRWKACLLALGILTLGSARGGEAIVLPPPAGAAVATGAVAIHDLDSLRAIALANNPSIAAARASLAAAIAGQQAVDNLRVPTFLQPDLPYRRQQACLGVQAAEAGVRQAELLTVFGVQFAYVSYLYASEQEQLAKEAVEDRKVGPRNLFNLSKDVRDIAEKAKSKAKDKDEKFDTDLKERDALFLEGVVNFARSRLAEAETGKKRALSALREALGLGCDAPLLLKHHRLLEVHRSLDLRQLIGLAVANRPDLLSANINVQVCELEVKAQGSRNSLNVRTFASGGDLHANPLPAGQYDHEYRPGVSGPEMPPYLSGKKCDRVNRAAALAARAASVRDKAQALITLEVEQAYLRYTEAVAKHASLTQAAAKLKEAVEGKEGVEGASKRLANTAYGLESKAALDDLLKFGQVYSQIRLQANEARYQQLIALVTLERATGGAFRADLSGAAEVEHASATAGKDE